MKIKTDLETCSSCGAVCGLEQGHTILWGGEVICLHCSDAMNDTDDWGF